MKPINWTCPHCSNHSTIKSDNFYQSVGRLTIENKRGNRAIYNEFIVCPNPDCREYSLTTFLFETVNDFNGKNWEWHETHLLQQWNLVPLSDAKVFPDFIPQPIIDDYNEACLIKVLSPKASATLSRRCLQGMIRDFWHIKKSRLVDEINELENKIDPLIWKSIDAVRKIGNIGAHMEKDINTIIDVDPNEANILIQLIEQLLYDWYIIRHERELKLKTIISIADNKTDAKKTNMD